MKRKPHSLDCFSCRPSSSRPESWETNPLNTVPSLLVSHSCMQNVRSMDPWILNRKIDGDSTTSLIVVLIIFHALFSFVFKVLESWSPKLSHENDGLIFNPAEEVDWRNSDTYFNILIVQNTMLQPPHKQMKKIWNYLLIFSTVCSLRKQPSFIAPGPSGVLRETTLGQGAKKDGCFRRLRWLKTVSSTFQDVAFDGSLLPLFISWCYKHGIKKLPNYWWTRWYYFRDTIGYHSNTMAC